MRIRYQVFTHTWDVDHHRPHTQTFLGLADTETEARALVANHSEETGTPVDYRRYSISVAPYSDPNALAQDFVQTLIRHGRDVESAIRGGDGACSGSYKRQVGGYAFPPDREGSIHLKPHQLYCQVGFDWRIYDLRALYAEAAGGVRQEALL